MSVALLRWAIFLMNVLLAGLGGVCVYVFYVRPLPQGEILPPFDPAPITAALAADENKSHGSALADYLTMINVLERPKPVIPPTPPPLENLQTKPSTGPGSGGPGGEAGKPATPVDQWVKANVKVSLVIYDRSEPNESTCLISLLKKGNLTVHRVVGEQVVDDAEILVKRIIAKKDKEGTTYTIVFADKDGNEGTAEYK